MSDISKTYSALSSSSPRTDVASVLQSIIDALPTAFDQISCQELIQVLLEDVKISSTTTQVSQGRLTPKDAPQALLAVKTLGKQPSGSEVLATPINLSNLLALSTASSFKDFPDSSNEALRCISNTLLLVEKARTTWVSEEVGGGKAAVALLEKSISPDQIFFASRILFLCTISRTTSGPYICSLVEGKHYSNDGIVEIICAKLDVLTTAILSGTTMANEAMTDLLKLTFNILFNYPMVAKCELEQQPQRGDSESEPKVTGDYWSLKLDGIVSPLLRVFSSLPPTFPAPLTAPLTHVIHGLLKIPIPPLPATPDTLLRALDLLDATLSHYLPGNTDPDEPEVRERCKAEFGETTLDELLSPLVMLITNICIADEASRMRTRKQIIPDGPDRTGPLETRPDRLGRCLRFLGSAHHVRLKDAVGEMLFAMCDSDATCLASHVGYSNVSGFLFNKGLISEPPHP